MNELAKKKLIPLGCVPRYTLRFGALRTVGCTVGLSWPNRASSPFPLHLIVINVTA